MAEGYIVRRGGMGGDGVGGQSSIFFQTTEPPHTNGGIWVKTNLTKYELTSTIVSSGNLVGKSWTFVPPQNTSSYTRFKGAVCIYKNIAYAAYENAEGMESANYTLYLQLQAMNLSNGVCTTISKNVASVIRTNRNTYYEAGSIAGYNNILLMANWPNMYIVTLSGVVTNLYVPTNIYYNCNTNIYESNVVPAWAKYTDSSLNKNIHDITIVNISSKTYTTAGVKTFPCVCIGTDVNSKISYARQYALVDGETTYRTYALNYSTNILSMKSSNTIRTRCGQCFLNGICYFFSTNLMAYNPATDTYTDLGMSIGTVSINTGYSLDSSGLCWCGASGVIEAYTLNGTTGTGTSFKTDTVYISTGGTKNYARIISGEGGSTDVPISGVYTVVNGKLTIFPEAYVSTGGAWTKVVY